jgi:transcriptional regulator with XRE-family HTH domain
VPEKRPRTPQGKRIGKALQNLRKRAGLTQEKLAEKADISPRYVQEIEIGTRVPSLKVMEALRRAVLCTWDELLGP